MKNEEYFLGIDLGWKEKKTTGICLLRKKEVILLKDIFARDFFSLLNPYLKETKVIAIDAPLTKGQGKGLFRLYEKFLSTPIFRREKVNPLPPALMPKLFQTARELVEELEKKGFVLNLNLIEVFPTLIKKIVSHSDLLKNIRLRKGLVLATKNQESALISAILALWHFQFKTRWLGYKDGFLFLPQLSLWKKSWQRKFKKAWQERSRLKYQHLFTNLFD